MKSVLVTGAYGGMGRAVCQTLSDGGFRVFALDKCVSESESGENRIIPIECDVTQKASVVSAMEKVKAQCDGLFAIIHLAGVYMLDSLVEMSEDEIRKIFDVNFFGAYIVNKVFLPLLSSKSRVLIITSELAPLDPLPFTGIYAVTKAALDKYAYSLRMELQLLGISVSVLRAGAVSTGMLDASLRALDRFCNKTELYTYNAARFKKIVSSVEARAVSAEKLAKKAVSVIEKKRPKFAYSINRNPLLLLLNVLPKRIQLFAIRMILKKK